MKKTNSLSFSKKLVFSKGLEKTGKALPVGQYRWTPALRMVAGLLIFSFLTLAIRLFLLQIVQREYFQAKRQEKVSQEIVIPALRGEIRDAIGTVLATNETMFRLLVVPKEYFEFERSSKEYKLRFSSIDRLVEEGRFTEFQKNEIIRKLENCQKQDQEAEQQKHQESSQSDSPKTGPRILCKDKELFLLDGLSQGQVARLESSGLKGIKTEFRSKRIYFKGDSRKINPGDPRPDLYCRDNHSAACSFYHVLGYLNEIETRELAQNKNYQPGNLIGRAGVERAFEKDLRGTPGKEKTILEPPLDPGTENKKPISKKVQEGLISGNNVVLNIDTRFQRMVKQSLNMRDYWQKPAKAAAVVEVDTGKILALVSMPALDPNLRMTPQEAKVVNKNPYLPLHDKTLFETYFPASTFKLITAFTAFRKKDQIHFDPKKKVTCTGAIYVKNQRFGCTGHHGKVDLHDAIQKSCNVYFYQLAQEVGLDAIAETAKEFGLGQSLNLGFGESTGMVPTEKYFETDPVYKRKGGFVPGYTLHNAIGQQDIKVTVLHMAMAYAAFANGGKLYQPLLADRIEDSQGKLVRKYEPIVRNTIPMSSTVYNYLLQAFKDVVQKKGGTAYRFVVGSDKKFPVDMAGKTGTAELGKKGSKTKDNAWFVGFAPASHPKIAIAVLVEHAGHGGEIAAPIAMKIAQDYFEKIDSSQNKPPSPQKEGNEH